MLFWRLKKWKCQWGGQAARLAQVRTATCCPRHLLLTGTAIDITVTKTGGGGVEFNTADISCLDVGSQKPQVRRSLRSPDLTECFALLSTLTGLGLAAPLVSAPSHRAVLLHSMLLCPQITLLIGP